MNVAVQLLKLHKNFIKNSDNTTWAFSRLKDMIYAIFPSQYSFLRNYKNGLLAFETRCMRWCASYHINASLLLFAYFISLVFRITKNPSGKIRIKRNSCRTIRMSRTHFIGRVSSLTPWTHLSQYNAPCARVLTARKGSAGQQWNHFFIRRGKE